MKTNLLLSGVALLWATATIADVPSDLGAIMGKNVALYANHDNGGAIDESTLKETTLDYKVVTLDGTSYVYMKASNNIVPGDGWGMQYRYWSETMGKIENNVTNKTATYATQVVTNSMPDPLKYISFFANVDGFTETDYITYNPTAFNNVDSEDKTAPVITEVTVTPSILSAALNITCDDDDAFYYIEDAANKYKAIALAKDAAITGLKGGTSYNLTITPVDFNGNKGTSITKSFMTAAEISEVRVAATTTTFNMAEGWGVFEDVTDPAQGQVLHAKAETGQAWAMVQANTPLPEGLGADGLEFSYAHAIVKCPKAGQVVRGSFTDAEVAMTNAFIPADEWQDVVFALNRGKIVACVIFMDYYGNGVPATLPKEIWLKEVVFNNNPTPLIEMAEDTESPVLTAASIVDGSLTYNSLQMNVAATDNIAVSAYEVTDAGNAYNGEFVAVDGVITVNKLSPATTYNFKVKAKDAAGNLSEAIEISNVTTPDRASEDKGDLGHFGTPADKMVHYEISCEDGKLIYTLSPIATDGVLNWAQIRLYKDGEFKGFDGMEIAQDGKSATYEVSNIVADEVIYNMFVWGFTAPNPAAHYQNAENEKLEDYIFYKVPKDATEINANRVNAGFSVMAVDGALQIMTDKAQPIHVYGIDGRRVSSVMATEGTTTVNGLAKGVYVVNNQKVVIK